MTREEAINIISQMIKDEEGFLSDNTVEAHKMALKALEREPILDKIRAEIEEVELNITYQENKDRKATWGLRKALEIIDKYRESEEER